MVVMAAEVAIGTLISYACSCHLLLNALVGVGVGYSGSGGSGSRRRRLTTRLHRARLLAHHARRGLVLEVLLMRLELSC